jgi:hypothetical protein
MTRTGRSGQFDCARARPMHGIAANAPNSARLVKPFAGIAPSPLGAKN